MSVKEQGTKVLRTERLLLRPFTLADAQPMYEGWATDPEVYRYMRWCGHQNPGETIALMKDWGDQYAQDPYYYSWAITLKATGTLIGSIGVLRHGGEDGAPTRWEPGYCLARPYWGKGYTTEAMAAVMPWALAHSGAGEDSVYACHALANPASGAVLRKSGFVYTHQGSYEKLDGTVLPAAFYRYSPEEARQNEAPQNTE